MTKTRRITIWALIGLITSIVILPFSTRLFHFLPVISLLQSFLFMTIFGFVAFFLCLLPEPWKLWGHRCGTLIVGLYLFGWFHTQSSLAQFGQPFGSLVILSLIIGLYWTVKYSFRIIKVEPETTIPLAATIILGLLAGKVILIHLVPARILIPTISPASPTSSPDISTKVKNIAYPFSVRVTEGLRKFDFVLRSSPEGNHLFILVLDALRADYVGRTVNGKSTTPTLDSLGKKGLSFPQFRTNSSFTKPSTASLFTGRYAKNHGVYYFGYQEGKIVQHILPNDYKTLAERLKNKNYATFGAVSSPLLSSYYGFDQGFDLYLDWWNGFRDSQYTLDQLLFWMLKKRPKKSFNYLHLKGPHHPYSRAYENENYWRQTRYYRGEGKLSLPNRFRNGTQFLTSNVKLKDFEIRFLRHLYGAEVNYIDENVVAPFLNSLNRLEISNSSLTIVTSDHGEELYERGQFGHGKNLSEESIKVPLILRAPTNLDLYQPPSNFLFETVDLSASLADYTGVSQKNFDGRSFLPLLQNPSSQTPDAFTESYAETLGEEKLETSKMNLNEATIVKFPWKLIYKYSTRSDTLLNLKVETDDTPIKNRSIIRKKLRDRLFSTLGSDSIPLRDSVKLKPSRPAERSALKALGYIQ